jgi:hypothetical protein
MLPQSHIQRFIALPKPSYIDISFEDVAPEYFDVDPIFAACYAIMATYGKDTAANQFSIKILPTTITDLGEYVNGAIRLSAKGIDEKLRHDFDLSRREQLTTKPNVVRARRLLPALIVAQETTRALHMVKSSMVDVENSKPYDEGRGDYYAVRFLTSYDSSFAGRAIPLWANIAPSNLIKQLPDPTPAMVQAIQAWQTNSRVIG